MNELRLLLAKVKAFEQDAHAILATHEASDSRVIVLEESYEKLTKLSLKQDELFRQAPRCVEHKLYRAAHVLAWAGFMDLLEEKLASDGLVKLRAARTAWKAGSIEELRENVVEYQLIEVAKELCPSQQTPHLQDEIYFIVRGQGVLFHDGKRDRFESGDLLFVAAGIEHQIEEISENFVMWRVFYGPHGGEV